MEFSPANRSSTKNLATAAAARSTGAAVVPEEAAEVVVAAGEAAAAADRYRLRYGAAAAAAAEMVVETNHPIRTGRIIQLLLLHICGRLLRIRAERIFPDGFFPATIICFAAPRPAL